MWAGADDAGSGVGCTSEVQTSSTLRRSSPVENVDDARGTVGCATATGDVSSVAAPAVETSVGGLS
eukprot:1835251-Lingulodinium_polyedra.AAC.1